MRALKTLTGVWVLVFLNLKCFEIYDFSNYRGEPSMSLFIITLIWILCAKSWSSHVERLLAQTGRVVKISALCLSLQFATTSAIVTEFILFPSDEGHIPAQAMWKLWPRLLFWAGTLFPPPALQQMLPRAVARVWGGSSRSAGVGTTSSFTCNGREPLEKEWNSRR